jgi:uncharacterized protein
LSIYDTLSSGQNVICYSPRRYGKTSMMMCIKDKLAGDGHIVFFIDFFRITSIEDLYAIYATSIADELRGPLKTLIQTIQTMLPTINPKIAFKSPESPTVEITVPIPVLAKSDTLRELFDSLEKYCAKKQKKGTVIFDEFQEVTIIPDGGIIEREMRSAFQHHKHVSYAFLGSKQNLLKGIFRDKNRPFFNFGRHFELDVIDAEHWKKFISKHMGLICSNEYVDRIIDTAERHPFYVQMYCHFIWDYAKRNKCHITEKVLDTVLDDILERDTMLFGELWDSITMKERHLLKVMAFEETKSIYDSRFILKNNLGTSSSIQKAVEKLLSLEYIKKTVARKIEFVNPFFRQWIRRKVPPSFTLNGLT